MVCFGLLFLGEGFFFLLAGACYDVKFFSKEASTFLGPGWNEYL